MKCLSIVIIFLLTTNVYGQYKIEPQFNNRNLNYLEGNNLNDFPIQLGIEFGVPVKVFGKNFFTSGIFGYLNINLSKKNIFLKFEYGNMWLNSELKDNTAPYGALSITAQIVKISEISKVYVDFGYGLISTKSYKHGGIKLGIIYFQSLSKMINISVAIKIPFISEARNNEFHFNPFLTLGLQIF